MPRIGLSFRLQSFVSWMTRVGLACVLVSSPSLHAQSYTWKNVAVSGAGAMVTDVYAHPGVNGLFYIRTDVGGSYRWNASTSTWIPLNDSLTFGQGEQFCCEGFALDPQSTSTVYYAGGESAYSHYGAIYKSSNQGNTWTQLTGFPNILMNGNGDQRWADCRLVVSPFSSSVILFGSRYNGLYRSADGGTTWTNITALPAGTSGYGVQSLAFDPATSGRVYAYVAGGAVYVSNDNGITWTSIGGSNVHRIKVGPDSTLWATTTTGVSKYSGGTWTNYTPGSSANIFGALAINPTNASDVLVEKGQSSPYSIWRTTDGGTTWTQETYTVASTATWAHPGFNNYRPNDFVFDPHNPSQVWGDRWLTTNINAATVAWIEQEAGHEEDVCGAIAAPPSGYEMLNGVFDDDGFAMNNGLDSYPTQQLGTTTGYNGHTWSMAYCETTPSTLVRLGFQAFYGGTISPVIKSADGGATWVRQTTFPTNLFPLDCAISATNPLRICVICDANYSTSTSSWSPTPATNPWRYTTDGGTTWNVVSGLPTPPSFSGPWGDNQFLAADHVNGSNMYYLDVNSTNNTTTGKVYRSVNSGNSFANCNPGSLLPSGKRWFELKTLPGTAGDIWACVDNYPSSGRTSDEGLYRSTDIGVTWTKISSVNRAFSFGFGKSSGSTPALYIYGRTNGGTTDALWMSGDLGATWTNITSPANNLGDYPSIIEGSRQTAGRVFVGTGGRGFFYGSSGGSPSITWGTPQNISSDSDVLTNGTYFDAALTPQGANGGSPLTVNGVAFNIIANGNVNCLDPSGDIELSSRRNPYSGGNSPSGSAAYNTLVAHTEYGQNDSQTVTLNNLTVGDTYQVQVWSASIGVGSYVTDVVSGNTAVLNDTTGQFVTGTFTAAATSLTFTTPNDPSSTSGVEMLNAVSVRQISP